MPTDIDIASNALLLIGDNPINSFTEPGAGAQVAGAIYQETYRAVLSEHPWTFALKEVKLARLTAAPDDLTGYIYAYQIPPDHVRTWALLPHSNFTVVGDLIYSNETELLLRYVYQVDETELPPHFTKALEYRLASEFAMSVTESMSRAEAWHKRYLTMVAQSRSIDSQGKPQEPIIDSPFTDTRFGGGITSSFYRHS